MVEINILGKQIYIRREIVIIAAVLIVLVLGVIGYVINAGSGEVIVSSKEADEKPVMQEKTAAETADAGEMENKAQADEKADEIKVYVVGCVKKPGVVTLRTGQIIEDAINAAGGATKDADVENINLAYELNENTMLKILSKNEMQDNQQNQRKEQKNADSKTPDNDLKGIKIVKDSGGAVAGKKSETEGPAEKGKININTATVSELDTLPGVGEKTANDIITYRESNGSFKKIEGIMDVPGIGESKFNKMKELITAE